MDNLFNKIFIRKGQFYFPVYYTIEGNIFFLTLYFSIDYCSLTISNSNLCFVSTGSWFLEDLKEISEYQFVFHEQVQKNLEQIQKNLKKRLEHNFNKLCQLYCFNYNNCENIKFLTENDIKKINEKIKYIYYLLFEEGE